jgi:hypothetical protein
MTYYCRLHPNFEGLTFGDLHDHIEKEHKEVQTKEQIATYFREQLEMADFRRSDGKMVLRTWGRVPVIASTVADNQIEK